jgi:prephenate dehydrogenase
LLIIKTYEDGIKEGRKQIIRNIKKNYAHDNWSEPSSYNCDTIAVSIPTSTLIKYFKEVSEVKKDETFT